MPEPRVRLAVTRLAGSWSSPRVLVVGPSLGTSVDALWGAAARLLHPEIEVVGWDLPGHGRSFPATSAFTVADLAGAVREHAAALGSGRPVAYAGVSLGGAVALQLALEPGIFEQVSCVASAARIGDPAIWQERAAVVRVSGTSAMVERSIQRWFAPDFIDRKPAVVELLLRSLSDADDESYALACDALAAFDLRERLGDVRVPVLVAAGEHDVAVPISTAEATAVAARGRFEVLSACGHLPPAEVPQAVAELLRSVVQEPDVQEAVRD
ncbi:MAG: alpha/beta fold hydrolase [Nocardioides sp.]